MRLIALLVALVQIGITPINCKREVPFENTTVEQRAEYAGLTVEEFVLFSSVVEAESNRCTDDTTGRRHIALVIINRVESDIFPNTYTEVLCQSGQFSTVRNGASVTNRTDLSDLAVIEALEWNEDPTSPEILFFNCRGFFSGRQPYGNGAIGGNYFSY